MTVTLAELLAEDGVKLIRSGNQHVCLCPFHKEKTPSCSVDLDRSLYHCFGCPAKGDAVDYLVEARKWTKARALQHVKGTAPSRVSNRRTNDQKPEGRSEAPKTQPAFITDLPQNAHSIHDYFTADGKLVFKVARVPGKGTRRKSYMPLARAKKNKKMGWLVTQPLEGSRPLYRLPELHAAGGDQQVIVVEGEKCADAMVSAFERAVVTTWAHGTQSWRKTDWTPLYGRDVLLAADADDGGRACMREIADMLVANGCSVRVVLPPDVPDDKGHDIADEIEAGGAAKAGAWLAEHATDHVPLIEPGTTDTPPEPEEPKKKKKRGRPKKEDGGDEPPVPELGTNPYFEILGNEGNMIVVKLASDQIMRMARSMITRPNQLLAIAPDVHWWLQITGADSFSLGVAQHVGAGLIKIADARGQIDMNRLTGRGVRLTDDGKYVWHLGDKLVVDGAETPIKDYEGTNDYSIYLSAPAVMVGDESDLLDSDTRQSIAETVMRYRWAAPDDGKTMLGWIATSIVGGALPWRPHIWFLGESDAGKSWFIREVIMRIGQSLAVRSASPSEASIARQLRSDSLPLIVDEAEPDQTWLAGIVTLARIAAAGDGSRMRADPGGDGVTALSPRFSVCMSSTKLPRLDDADNNRFCMVQLHQEGVADWLDLEEALINIFAPPSPLPRQIRTTLVHHTPHIAEQARAITRQIQREEKIGRSRQAMLRGALSAGWQWWSGTDEVINIQHPSPIFADQAEASLVLQDLLATRVREHGGTEKTLLELLAQPGTEAEVVRYGVVKKKDGLLINPKHREVTKVTQSGKWKSVDVSRLLRQLPRVKVSSNPRRFGHHQRVRSSIRIPYDTLNNLGIMLTWSVGQQERLDDPSF